MDPKKTVSVLIRMTVSEEPAAFSDFNNTTSKKSPACEEELAQTTPLTEHRHRSTAFPIPRKQLRVYEGFPKLSSRCPKPEIKGEKKVPRRKVLVRIALLVHASHNLTS
jgi:hypothetical protein